MIDLDGALAKVGRAEEHLRCLSEEIRGWREENRNRMTRDHNAKRTEWRFYTDWDPPPDPVRWALLLGDGIHNLRSALDHAVYACSGQKPPDRCEFPIFLNRDKYLVKDERGGLYKIRGIQNVAVRAIIEGAQPWQRDEGAELDLLWMVQWLDIQDKHRLITPVTMNPQGLRGKVDVELFRITGESSAIFGPGTVPLESHALLFTVQTPTAAKSVKVNAAFTLGVGVRVPPKGRHVGITYALGEPCQYVRWLIEQIRDAVGQAVPPPAA